MPTMPMLKNPHDSSEAHADPDTLLKNYLLLRDEIQNIQGTLRDSILEALGQ